MEPFAGKLETFISLAQTVSDHGPGGVKRVVEMLELLVREGEAQKQELERERNELASEISRTKKGRKDMEHWTLRLQNADMGDKLESVDQCVQGGLAEIQTSLQTMSAGMRDDTILERLGDITRNLQTVSATALREVKAEIERLTRSSDTMKQDIMTKEQLETLISNGNSSIIDEIRSDTRCLSKLDGTKSDLKGHISSSAESLRTNLAAVIGNGNSSIIEEIRSETKSLSKLEAIRSDFEGRISNLGTVIRDGYSSVTEEIQSDTRCLSKLDVVKSDLEGRISNSAENIKADLGTVIRDGHSSVIEGIRSDTRCLSKLDAFESNVEGRISSSVEDIKANVERVVAEKTSAIVEIMRSEMANLAGVDEIGQRTHQVVSNLLQNHKTDMLGIMSQGANLMLDHIENDVVQIVNDLAQAVDKSGNRAFGALFSRLETIQTRVDEFPLDSIRHRLRNISGNQETVLGELRELPVAMMNDKLDGVSGLQRQSMESFEGLSRAFSCLDNKIDGLPKSVASELKEDVESISQSCREMAGNFERWRTEFQSVNKGNAGQISSLEVQIDEYRKQVNQLSSDLSALRSQASTASEAHISEVTEKDNRAAELIVEIEELKNARGLLEERLTMKEEELAKVTSDVSKLRNEVDAANQTIARQLEIHNEDMRRARELQDRDSGQLQEIRTRAHALAEENGDLRTQVAQATSQKALSDQIMRGMENAIKSNTDFEGVETRARDLSAMYKKRSDELDEAKESVRLLKSKAADYDKLKLRYEDYQIESAEANVEHEDETEGLGVMLSNTERENSVLKSKVESLEGDVANLQRQLEEKTDADGQDSGSRPLKRRCNTTPPPTDDEECCLAQTLKVIAGRASQFQIVEDDQYNMDLVLILTNALSDIGRAKKLLKFLEAGTTGAWFCFHEAYEKGRRTGNSVDPLHQRCTLHGNVCNLLVMTEVVGSARRLKFRHL